MFALQQLRLAFGASLCPVVIVSGDIGEEAAIEALKAGATDYVLKQRLSRLGPVVLRALAEVRERDEKGRAEEALRQSEERFRLLIEGVQDYAILTLDPQGRITSWNAAASRLYGWSAQEALGQHCSIFSTSADRESGLVHHDLEETSPGAVLADACCLSLFAPRRLLWISSAEAALPRGDGDPGRGAQRAGVLPLGVPLPGAARRPAAGPRAAAARGGAHPPAPRSQEPRARGRRSAAPTGVPLHAPVRAARPAALPRRPARAP